jgi:hypothetical protein
MTTAQMRKYRAEWAKALAALRRYNRAATPAAAEAERMRIHQQVTGSPCSSKDLTNDEYDQVLALFYAWSRADDLDAQLDQIQQPARRCRWLADDLIHRINAQLLTSDREKQMIQDHGRDAYLLYLARRFGQPDLIDTAQATPATWSKIIACLMIRYDQVAGIRPGKGTARRYRPYDKPSRRFDQPAPVTSDNPF